MSIIIKTTVTLLTLGFACGSRAGDITGRVILKGTPPPEVTFAVAPDAALAAKYPNGMTTHIYQVSPDGGLQHVLVFLRGDFRTTTFEPPRKMPLIDHMDGLFQPYVLGIRTGQQLRLRCSDSTICSFVVSPKANRGFSLTPGLKPELETTSPTFTEAEVPIRFRCDIHRWNYAYIGVFAHPYFAVTDEQGRFTIRAAPAGSYTLEIFHPKAGTNAQTIVVSDKATTANFEMTAR